MSIGSSAPGRRNKFIAERRAGRCGGLFTSPTFRERHQHHHDERDAGDVCGKTGAEKSEAPKRSRLTAKSPANAGLNYFTHRVGAESATMLQVGTPFDYEQQMKLCRAKMPDPRDTGYAEALQKWMEHFITQTHGKAFVLLQITS